MKDYKFSEDWFSHNIPAWREHLKEFAGIKTCALEIGCFEGKATIWLLENILTHPESTIFCIDTFEGSPEHELMNVGTENLYQRFTYNIKESGSVEKVFPKVGTSAEWLSLIIAAGGAQRDFAYIDGSHATADVFLDIALVWQIIKVGGIIILDDYLWMHQWDFDMNRNCDFPKPAIDAFLRCFSDQIEILHMGWQVIVRKTERRITNEVKYL